MPYLVTWVRLQSSRYEYGTGNTDLSEVNSFPTFNHINTSSYCMLIHISLLVQMEDPISICKFLLDAKILQSSCFVLRYRRGKARWDANNSNMAYMEKSFWQSDCHVFFGHDMKWDALIYLVVMSHRWNCSLHSLQRQISQLNKGRNRECTKSAICYREKKFF